MLKEIPKNFLNDNQSLISIVIPTFNCARYLEEAVDSVLGQDYPNIELIVLDDGSTDNTDKILTQYADRLYWESHPNMGQANTLNKGWQMAQGEVLAYLSADDFLMPNAVSTSIKHFQSKPDIVLTYCDFDLIDPQSRTIRRVKPPDFNYYDMVVKTVCFPGPGVFFRRMALERAGLWNSDYRQMPDYDYWIRLGLVGRFYHIPETLASFRVHKESLSFAKGDVGKSEEPIRIITDFFKRQNIPAEILAAKNEALSNAYLNSGQLHWRSGRYKAGFDMIKKAITLHCSNLWSTRTLRLIINAFLNRLGHQIVWTVRGLF